MGGSGYSSRLDLGEIGWQLLLQKPLVLENIGVAGEKPRAGA